MRGHLRGYLTRAGGKAKWRIMHDRSHGGCTLSHETVVMKSNQQINRNQDSSGGNASSLDRYPNQCDFRPGGILRSGKARIGINGVAGSGGTAGTPNFKSMPRPLAAAGMLPQGRLAGEQCALHAPIWHSVGWAGSHLFLCYRMNVCIDCQCGSRSLPRPILCSHGSGAYPWEGFLVSTG